VNTDGTVSSAAYKLGGKPDNQISVDLAKLTTPEESVQRARRPGAGLGFLRVGFARSLAFMVRHVPVAENFSHCQIEGQNSRQKCRLLAEATTVIIPPRDLSQTSS
jgi:hypothetical protein